MATKIDEVKGDISHQESELQNDIKRQQATILREEIMRQQSAPQNQYNESTTSKNTSDPTSNNTTNTTSGCNPQDLTPECAGLNNPTPGNWSNISLPHPSPASQSNYSQNSWGIAGSVIGGILVLLLCYWLNSCCKSKRKSSNPPESPKPTSNISPPPQSPITEPPVEKLSEICSAGQAEYLESMVRDTHDITIDQPLVN